MKDEVFNKNIEQIESIISKLTGGDLPVEEGKRLKQQAEELIKKNRDMLEEGDGKVVILVKENGEIIETPLEL